MAAALKSSRQSRVTHACLGLILAKQPPSLGTLQAVKSWLRAAPHIRTTHQVGLVRLLFLQNGCATHKEFLALCLIVAEPCNWISWDGKKRADCSNGDVHMPSQLGRMPQLPVCSLAVCASALDMP